MAYTFNGVAKTITLSAGTVTLDLVDLHSRWKDWVFAGNAQYAPAFRAVGGDIPAIPLYLFLLNGWRIVPQSANHILTVTNGVLEVDGGGEPFNDQVGTYVVRINRQTPGIAIGYSSNGVAGPSASDIAAAVWQRAIENGHTSEQMIRIMFAALAGTSEQAGSTIVFKSADGATSRIIGSFDAANNRVGVILDGH